MSSNWEKMYIFYFGWVNLACWWYSLAARDQSSWREWVPILQPKMYVVSTLLWGKTNRNISREGGSPSIVFWHIAVLGSFKQTLCITSPRDPGQWRSLGPGAYQENNVTIHQRDRIILCSSERQTISEVCSRQVRTSHLPWSYPGWWQHKTSRWGDPANWWYSELKTENYSTSIPHFLVIKPTWVLEARLDPRLSLVQSDISVFRGRRGGVLPVPGVGVSCA